jgi:hypothetical protein
MRNGILLAAWLAAVSVEVYSEKTLLVFRVSEKIGE